MSNAYTRGNTALPMYYAKHFVPYGRSTLTLLISPEQGYLQVTERIFGLAPYEKPNARLTEQIFDVDFCALFAQKVRAKICPVQPLVRLECSLSMCDRKNE